MAEKTLECTLFLYSKIEIRMIRTYSDPINYFDRLIEKISNLDHCMMFQTTQATYDWTFICLIVTSFEGKEFRRKTMTLQKISVYIIVNIFT